MLCAWQRSTIIAGAPVLKTQDRARRRAQHQRKPPRDGTGRAVTPAAPTAGVGWPDGLGQQRRGGQGCLSLPCPRRSGTRRTRRPCASASSCRCTDADPRLVRRSPTTTCLTRCPAPAAPRCSLQGLCWDQQRAAAAAAHSEWCSRCCACPVPAVRRPVPPNERFERQR
jgi:hypothetical protein